MEGPANTLSYFIAGYAVIFGVMALYLVSLIMRQVNLKRDLEMLEDMEKQEQKQASAGKAHQPTA